jgi:hypothetical protein
LRAQNLPKNKNNGKKGKQFNGIKKIVQRAVSLFPTTCGKTGSWSIRLIAYGYLIGEDSLNEENSS